MGAVRALATAAMVFVAVMLAGLALKPDAVRAQNGAAQFDAQNAHARLARILGDETPHPVDSAAGDAVRARLLQEIEALGFTPALQEAFACSASPRDPSAGCALVRNVSFELGSAPGKAVLVSAHYDSVPAGPGASDDGMGVATLLETARLLKADPPQRRIIFLLTDGEEPGLLGAVAFRDKDPRFAEIDAVVNLEARGTSGLASFFETNRPNGAAVRAYAAHALRPSANSIMAAIYELLPNSTDVTVLRREGLNIVNMAMIDDFQNYHTPQDSLANQDLASLQNMGDNTLATARAFAKSDGAGAQDDLVFSDIASRGFIVAPEGVATVLLGLSAAVALALYWLRAPAPRIRAFLLAPVWLVGTGLFAFVLGLALNQFRPGYWWAHPEYTRAWTALAALAFGIGFVRVLAPQAQARTLSAAGAAWFASLGFIATLFLPGASILFLPISAPYAIGAAVSLAWRPAFWGGVIVAAVAALVFWAPMLASLEVALGYDAPIGAMLGVVMLSLPLIGLMSPQRPVLWPTLALAGCTAAALVLAIAAPRFSMERPRPLNLIQLVDADQHTATLVAGPAALPLPPALHAQATFARAKATPWDRSASWTAQAAWTDAPIAEAIIDSDRVVEGQRIVRLHLATPGAAIVSLRIPVATGVRSARVNGERIDFHAALPDSKFTSLYCNGRACDGAAIELILKPPPAAGAQGDWLVSGFYPGLAPALADLAAARPAWTTPIQSGDGIATLKRLTPHPAQ